MIKRWHVGAWAGVGESNNCAYLALEVDVRSDLSPQIVVRQTGYKLLAEVAGAPRVDEPGAGVVEDLAPDRLQASPRLCLGEHRDEVPELVEVDL